MDYKDEPTPAEQASLRRELDACWDIRLLDETVMQGYATKAGSDGGDLNPALSRDARGFAGLHRHEQNPLVKSVIVAQEVAERRSAAVP